MSIGRRLRFEILRRDGYTCRYCGAQAPDVPLDVDHVIPVALGGPDDPSNLVTSCKPCNAGKGSIQPDQPVVDDVAADALRWKAAIEVVDQMRMASFAVVDEQVEAFVAHWNEVHHLWTLQPNDLTTVRTFLERGLLLEELTRYVDKAMTISSGYDGRWRYFCGIGWRVLTQRDEEARRLLEDGEVR